MEIVDGKVARCTEDELYELWLRQYACVMPFGEYKWRCERAGTVVANDDGERVSETIQRSGAQG